MERFQIGSTGEVWLRGRTFVGNIPVTSPRVPGSVVIMEMTTEELQAVPGFVAAAPPEDLTFIDPRDNPAYLAYWSSPQGQVAVNRAASMEHDRNKQDG